MARPKNIEGRAEMRRAAFRLFMEQGYTATTYVGIANAVGKERTHVQAFFPKKELLAVDFLNSVVRANELFARDEGLLTGEPLVDFYAIGQLNIAFHVRDEGMRRFTRDVLADRALSLQSLIYNGEWVEQFLGTPDADRAALLEAFIMAQGGGDELLFRQITDGIPVDAFQITGKIILSFAALMGMDGQMSDVPEALPAELVERSNAFVEAYVLQ